MRPITLPLRDGLRRVLAAPAVLLGAWLLTVAMTLPLGLLLRGELQVVFGDILTPARATNTIPWDWWQQISAHASGIGQLYVPPIIVTATLLTDLSSLLDGNETLVVIGLVSVAHLVVWNFLQGGVIDRYARNRPTRSAGFFSACGLHVFRLLRLTLIAGLAYVILFGFVFGWFHRAATSMSTLFTSEAQAFSIQCLIYLVFSSLLICVNLVVDYARVRTIVEDRHSMLGGLLAGWRFVLRHPARCISLYAANGLVLIFSILLYTLATSSNSSTWIIFLGGQIYLIIRLIIALLFSASEVSYFQSQLAHTGYVATPPPVWPESPTAEALGRIT